MRVGLPSTSAMPETSRALESVEATQADASWLAAFAAPVAARQNEASAGTSAATRRWEEGEGSGMVSRIPADEANSSGRRELARLGARAKPSLFCEGDCGENAPVAVN